MYEIIFCNILQITREVTGDLDNYSLIGKKIKKT
jgi:hypothetical protein